MYRITECRAGLFIIRKIHTLKAVYTITIHAENNLGVLVRIATIISRRRIPIESLNVVQTEVEGIQRLTVVIKETEEVVRKLVQQIDKQVDVLRTSCLPGEETLLQQQILPPPTLGVLRGS